MTILRVFPRKTHATPDDENVRIGSPTLFDKADQILISVTFSWDKERAYDLADEWHRVGNVTLGGVAYGDQPDEFEVGKFLKVGNVITSRGCHNKCWFCNVWRNEGKIREIEIKEGNIIQDNNLLACSRKHIEKVFKMLESQHAIEFRGGLEAKILEDWHIEAFTKLRIKQMFFAYDTPDDLDPLIDAGKRLIETGFKRDKLRCYVLIGYKTDTFEKAEKRLLETWKAGFLPFAMLYTQDGKYDKQWRKFQRQYVRPAITKHLFQGRGVVARVSQGCRKEGVEGYFLGYPSERKGEKTPRGENYFHEYIITVP